MQKPPETVTATEIAAWVYCPEQWRLTATGHESTNQPALDRGTARHRELAAIERRTRYASASSSYNPGPAPRRRGCAVVLFQLVAIIGTTVALCHWVVS